MLLQYIPIFHPHDVIYFVNSLSPSCSMMLPPRASRLGWCSLACKLLPFPPNITMVIMAKQFLFDQTRGHFSKKYHLCPHVQLQTVVWLFLWWFWSSGFLLAEQPFRLCRYRTRFICGYRYFCTCFLQHLHNFLCCCSGIDLHFSH
jgi:hypothetical protein